MNKAVERFSRDFLKSGLAGCNTRQLNVFRRMYSHENLDLSVFEIAENMDAEKLDTAICQVERTLENNAR